MEFPRDLEIELNEFLGYEEIEIKCFKNLMTFLNLSYII